MRFLPLCGLPGNISYWRSFLSWDEEGVERQDWRIGKLKGAGRRNGLVTGGFHEACEDAGLAVGLSVLGPVASWGRTQSVGSGPESNPAYTPPLCSQLFPSDQDVGLMKVVSSEVQHLRLGVALLQFQTAILVPCASFHPL